MIEQLKEWDVRLFLYLNDQHIGWMDTVMYWVTDRYFWIPMYAFLILWTYRHFGLPGFWMILAACLAVALADQVTSGWMKPYFGRLRPCYDLAIKTQVHVVRGCGGQYSFASSHASTTFALAASLWIFLRQVHVFRYIWILFPWAALVSYSRIYVGVHYPLDILVGAIIGCLCALLLFLLYTFLMARFNYQVRPLSKYESEHLVK